LAVVLCRQNCVKSISLQVPEKSLFTLRAEA